MIGPQLQTAIYEALVSASPPIAGGRVYDRVPANPTFAYITIGDEQVLDDGNSCQDGWEVFSDVHVWSRPAAGSKVEVKTIAAAVVAAVKAITAVAGFSLVTIQHETTRVLRDTDGITEHAVVSFRAILDPA